MKKQTLLKSMLFLMLGLVCNVAWGQAGIRAEKGSILSHEDLMALTEPTDIVIQNISGTNRWYFCGNKNLQTFETNSEAWFVWEPAGEGEFYLKKKFPTEAQGEGYLQKNAPSAIGAKETAQKFTAVYKYPTDAPASGTDVNLVRFVRADNTETWINCQTTSGTPVYNSGTGAFTMHNVYRLDVIDPLALPKLTTDENNPIWYSVVNTRSNKYMAYAGDAKQMTQEAAADISSIFYFTADDSEVLEGFTAIKVHTYLTGKLMANNDSWTEEGITWYLHEDICTKIDGVAAPKGLHITKNQDLSAELNGLNDGESGTRIVLYDSNDVGSIFFMKKNASSIADLVAAYIESHKAAAIAEIEKLARITAVYPAAAIYIDQINGITAASNAAADVNAASAGIDEIVLNYKKSIDGKAVTFQNNGSGDRNGRYLGYDKKNSRAAAIKCDDDADEAIWTFKVGDDGMFKLYNFVNDLYLGDPNSAATHAAEKDAPSFRFEVSENNEYPSTFVLVCSNGQWVHVENSANNNYKLMSYQSTTDGASLWTIKDLGAVRVTRDDYNAKKNVLNDLISYVKRLQDEFGLVKSGEKVKVVVNHPSGGDSQPSSNLLDGNNGTFVHSSYDNGTMNDVVNHYIEVELSAATQNVFCYLSKRNNNNRPAIIKVYAGNSAEEINTEVATLNMNECYDNNVQSYFSKGINLEAAYTHLRFVVTATNTDTKFFTLSEFYVLPVNDNTMPISNLTSASITDVDFNTKVTAAQSCLERIPATEEEISAAQEALSKTGVGYPKANSTVCTALSKAIETKHMSAIATALNNFKNSTDIQLPEPGKAYKMAFKPKSGGLIHITASGTSLSTGTEGSVFYCVQGPSADYPYVLVSAEGNFLSYKVGNDGTIEDALTTAYTSEVNDVKVGAMVGVNSNVDDNTIDLRFGTVYVKTDKRPGSYKDDDGCLVYKTKSDDIRYDGAKDPFFKDDFTSAIVMTEVEAEGNEAVAAAILSVIKVNAKAVVAGNASKLGEGIGYAYYMAGETKLYTADEVNAAIDAAATIEDVNAITNSFKYEVPKAGTPYYLFDAVHNVYVDIHHLGAESNYPAVNQMATLSSEQQPLYITANPADGSWKIHTTLRGGSYLCQYTGGKQTWDSWVSADASNYSWGVEVSKDAEVLYYVLKNTGSAGGYLGREDHSNGKVLYANQTDERYKLKLQLIEVPEEKPSVFVYRPTTRATTLENGKKYMIYNTAFDGNEDRTGFLYDNGSGMGHSGAPKQKPATFKTIQEAYLWEVVTTDEEGKYYLKAADGTYVNVSGGNGNAEPAALYIQPWNTSTADKAGVKSEGADGAVIENANIGADVFTISGTKQGHTGRDCWNGNPNGFSMWESAHPYAFYEFEATEKTFDEGFPIPGRTYYIYCDNDTRQYFYNDGGTLKVSEKRTEWSNEYLFTCSFDGQYFQFKNMKGKYLAHKTLSDNAHNFELASYLGGVNLKTPGGSYFVMKADGGFDQSSEGQYDPASTNFSTVYKFEEFNFPVDGEVYYIYADTYQDGAYVNRFLYADGGNLKLNTSLSTANAYLWTCTVTEDGYVQFRNGAGKYLKHKGVQDSPYNFTLNKNNANHAIAATLFSVDANRYFTVKNNGSSFDQADRTYNQTSEEWCTDYVFMPINDVQVLTVNGSCWSDAQATWNGETKTLPASWAITPHTVISDATLSVTGSDNFTFTGLYDGTTSLGETTEIESLDGSLTLTAKLVPSFFSASTTEGDLIPVRIRNVRENSYTLRLNANENYTGKAVNSGVTAYGENEIWYLVGNEESFKIYHRIAGTGLHIVLEGTGENSAASMNTKTTNADFCLVTKDNGYAICPKSNTGQSFNMNGGAGKDIKLYRTSDGGSSWTIEKMDVTNTLTLNVNVDQVWESSPRVAELTLTIDGLAGQTRILGDVEGQALYLPVGATYEVSSMTYRGYTYNGCTENEGVLTASYTANDERTLFYSPRDGHPYRIPAIATAPNGDIFAICDYRPCGNDIGHGEVDLVCRVSSDNGVTWTEERTIADGLGHINDGIWKMGFGDPAIVADRESNKVLVMSVCGNRTCWDGNYGEGGENENPNRISRLYIEHDGEKWVYGQPEEVTYDIYPLFKNEGGEAYAASMFIGAGKICQSRVVKKGEYYRLYCAVWNVTKTQRQHHNYVIYSDDFGETWNVLGDLGYENSASKWGNEPKVQELPDGTVVLSSRKYNGRYFNLFTFADDTYTTGSWMGEVGSNEVQDGLSFGGNSTNGEIYKVKAIHKESGRICDLMFQSIPTGGGRDNVAIYYKEMEYDEDGTNKYTSTTFAQGWTKGIHVSTKESCYSTMISQADGRIAFFFEEEPSGYCMVYIPYTIEELTGSAYTLYTVNSTIGQYEIGTFYASEAVVIPEGVKAYVATEQPEMKGADAEGNVTGVITMTELEGIIPAHTGAVLRGEAKTYEFIPSISYGTPVEGNMMVGYEAADNKSGSMKEVNLQEVANKGDAIYFLTVKNDKAGFYAKTTGKFSVANNKAYLQIHKEDQEVRAIYFDFDDNTTAIESAFEDEATGVIYDLQGRQLKKATSNGIYIVNGKKVLK